MTLPPTRLTTGQPPRGIGRRHGRPPHPPQRHGLPEGADPDPVSVGAALHRVGRVLARLDGPTPAPTPTSATELPRTAVWKFPRVAKIGGPDFDGPGAPLAAALLRAAVNELPPRLTTQTTQLLADHRRRTAFVWPDTVGRLLAPWPAADKPSATSYGSARDVERLP